MRISPVTPIGFKQIVETYRKENTKEEEKQDTYEVTVTYTETIKVPKDSKALQQINYVV